ncbi:MAG TPA: glutathione S-transferase N-terminal domain-containing protein [Solirubrobacteraceae bacterium]|jgi:glutathione S-transferase|nr:glutathione S-transferase N-terminal domain-containing protein [Solirubrobacteraceae bacterium]
MNVRLFSIPGSHAATTGQLLLEHKGIAYRRIDLLPAVSWVALRALRFRGVTVPAAIIDGERVQGTRAIARVLERLQPEPPLFPDEPTRRQAVEEAERFGDEDLQQRVREIFLWSVCHDRSGLVGYLEGARIGIPHWLAARTATPFIALDARARGATAENVRRALTVLPVMLDRIDDWIRDGVLGGEAPNAADLQIAPSLRLAMSLDDLRPAIEGRPAGRLATRIVRRFPGRTPLVLPGEWLAPIARASLTAD